MPDKKDERLRLCHVGNEPTTIPGLFVASAVSHCFSSIIIICSCCLPLSPEMIKSTRLAVNGIWYSIATPTSSGNSGILTTLYINCIELAQERTSFGDVCLPRCSTKALVNIVAYCVIEHIIDKLFLCSPIYNHNSVYFFALP